ncbi:MAG: alpha-E domain-containing protein, partial [Firmicutes bacterium]|nr:alpha-E domain-containing protein [Bacillota bacterium]
MLSRVAEHLYWMARYSERAQNLARMVNIVSLQASESLQGEQDWAVFLR